MDYTVSHVTRFDYAGPVYESVMEVRLAPRTDQGQAVQRFELTTSPSTSIFEYLDPLGNLVHHFGIVAPHDRLVVSAQMHVRTPAARALPDRIDPGAWDVLKGVRADGSMWDFFEPSPRVPLSPAVAAFADRLDVDDADPLSCYRGIVRAIHAALTYAPDATTVDTPLEAALEARRGVCQDFAHITLAVARARGLPCRYVSGYLAPAAGPKGAEDLMTHAWIEAWLPGLEWVPLDPTHDTPAGDRHIRLAVGRDYGDAAPTRGVFRGGPAGALSVAVRIEPEGGESASSEITFPLPRPVTTAAAPVPSADQ
jgi:transglutaminase-like putative cysteine protease